MTFLEEDLTRPAAIGQQDRPPLRFQFRGYSIWLDVEQFDMDLDKACRQVACDFGLIPVPSPHVTVVYGMKPDNADEDELRLSFRDKISNHIQSWPSLVTMGGKVDIELDGVNGGEMDMAWMELSLGTSREHEAHVDAVRSLFDCDLLSGCWEPHCSLAYDNPEESPLNVACFAKLLTQFPSLMGHRERKVKGISLWKTKGSLSDWECLERIPFNNC